MATVSKTTTSSSPQKTKDHHVRPPSFRICTIPYSILTFYLLFAEIITLTESFTSITKPGILQPIPQRRRLLQNRIKPLFASSPSSGNSTLGRRPITDKSSLPNEQTLDKEKSIPSKNTTTTSNVEPPRTPSTDTTTSSPTNVLLSKPPPRRKLGLSWCGRDATECLTNTIRETVVDDNHITFNGPATGQVAYNWIPEDDSEPENAVFSVLILVKRDDDELMTIAAESVRELTADGIRVLLDPELAAKLKHYFGVDDQMIRLFESKPVPGFGGNHLTKEERLSSFAGVGSSKRTKKRKYEEPDPDLICTLGGDGLLMYAGMLFPGPVPPILCVAGGSMGFLTPFSKEEMVPAIRKSLGMIMDGDGGEERKVNWKVSNGLSMCVSMRMRLDCKVVNREGIVRARFNVLNEVAIDRGSSPYLANLECYCDNIHLTTVQADGIIFSTPTGSTAYSMAAGGSVVHPAVPAILVTPICPHVLSFRSMVFPDSVILRCYVPDDARAGACVAFDGKFHRELHRGDSVQIQMSVHPVPTINRMDHSSDWLTGLKRNFNFNSRVVQKPL